MIFPKDQDTVQRCFYSCRAVRLTRLMKLPRRSEKPVIAKAAQFYRDGARPPIQECLCINKIRQSLLNNERARCRHGWLPLPDKTRKSGATQGALPFHGALPFALFPSAREGKDAVCIFDR